MVSSMKVAIVGTAGIPASYGGFETLAENLVTGTSGINYTVYCSAKHYQSRLSFFEGAKLQYAPFSANGWQSVLYDCYCLVDSLFKKPDCVLILGVSGCVFLPIYRFFSNARVITNVDGIEWKRAKWGRIASAFLRFSEGCAVRFSDEIISDNDEISRYISARYGCSPVTIPYGGDHAVISADINDPEPNADEFDYFLSICRIEPENNIRMLLEAFSDACRNLVVVGNWMASDYGRRLFAEYSAHRYLDLRQPIYELKQLAVLRKKCTAYVHGHSAGGTNPSLVEIMHFEKPVIAFDCSYNRATTEGKAVYFSDSQQLIEMLDQADIWDGKPMKEIACRRYTWQKVCRAYLEVFDSGR